MVLTPEQVADIRPTLEHLYQKYHQLEFIENDPLSIPHLFVQKEDIEISGFWASVLAWGARPIIIRNSLELLKRMDNAPFEFLTQSTLPDLSVFNTFKHRTIQAIDVRYYMESLRNIYLNHGGLESVFSKMLTPESENISPGLIYFRQVFFELPHPQRSQKHIGNIARKSAAKRLNMFLRWMVRKDDKKIDFGIWKQIKPAQLLCPLDVHSRNVAHELGLLSRNANDWAACLELSNNLRLLDSYDPIRFDFALFGWGVNRRNTPKTN